MTVDTRPSGAWIRQRVFGETKVQPTASGDPFLAPFFETAIEHIWGGLWNRPGLDLKYRSLVVVSVLAASGQTEELKPHLRGALNLG
jgi:4-carboxymuconolactone decarboxylase